jgi:RNA recognition motif-containing protein
MPNASKPFKMNWGQHQKMAPTLVPTSPIMPMQKECSIYVCDLDVSTSEAEVVQFFQLRYRSAFAAKLIQDPNTGMNKGYGFVKFANQEEANRAIKEMNG